MDFTPTLRALCVLACLLGAATATNLDVGKQCRKALSLSRQKRLYQNKQNEQRTREAIRQTAKKGGNTPWH